MNHKVGIVLVNYNSYKYTLECLDSLEKEKYVYKEIYVIDNASNDESIKYLSESKFNFKLIRSKKNLGFSGGNNLGIEQALKDKCKYILLLNNDTVVIENFLTTLLETMNKDTEIGMATGKILYYDEPKKINVAGGEICYYKGKVNIYGENEIDLGQYNSFRYITFASGCLQLIKAEVFEKVGLYNEEYFLYYEDADFCKRVLDKGYKIAYEPRSVIYHKVSASSNGISENVLYYNARNRLMFVEKNVTKLLDRIIFLVYYISTRIIAYLKWSEVERKSNIEGIKDYFKQKVGRKE